MRELRRLLRENADYRRLWLAQVVSLAGDWFTLLALSVVVSAKSGGSGLLVSLNALAAVIPYAVIGPFSGILVDRFDRRRLMVVSDLVRVGLLLLLVLAVRGDRLWPVLLLAFLHFTVATLFDPARAALLPDLVSDRDLVLASSLASATWSAMAAIGGLLAGSAVALLGPGGALALDALTFLTSAALLLRIRPSRPGRAPEARQGGSGLSAALAWLRQHPVTGLTLLVKTMNGLASFDTVLVLFGTRVFVLGDGGALSTGLLFAAIGAGAVTGPLVMSRFNDGRLWRMRRLIAVSSWTMALGMLVLSGAPALGVALAGAFLRAFGGAGNWTFVTVSLQKAVPGPLRGRVFALDLAAAHLAAAFSSLAAGIAADRLGLRPTVLAMALAVSVPALCWTLAQRWMDRREAATR